MAGVALRSSAQTRRKAPTKRLQRRSPAVAQKPARKVKKIKKRGVTFQWRLLVLFILTIALSQLGFYLYSQNGPLFIEVLKFPGRVVTASINGGIGAITTGFEGVIETEQQFAERTFAHANEDPMMIPVGIVSIAVAVPVGFLSKAPDGMMRYGQEGYAWWDEWFPSKSR